MNYPDNYKMRLAHEKFDVDTADPSGNRWTYVDVRDLIAAIAAAIDPETDIDGHEAVLVTAAENFIGRDTADTIEAVHLGSDRGDALR